MAEVNFYLLNDMEMIRLPILRTPVNISVPVKKPFEYNEKIVYLEDSTEIDITSDVLIWSIERRSLKYGIGGFVIVLNNNNGQYLNKINENTIIRIYADKGSATPSNRVFRGRIDNPLYSLTEDNAHLKVIIGRDWPETEGEIIGISFSAAEAKSVFSSVISQKFSNLLTTNNVSTNMTTSITYSYVDEKPINLFSDVLKKSNHNGYIDMGGDIHTFADGEEKNNNESVIYGTNLLPYSNFGKDFLNSFNKIKGYGSQSEGLLLVRTSNNLADQQSKYIKAKIISESVISKINELQEKVASELDFSEAVTKGSISVSEGLFTLQPGQSIKISDPFSNISGYYVIPVFSMQRNQDGSIFTQLTIEKPQSSDTTDLLKMNEDIKKLAINNPNSLDDTVFLFNFSDSTDIQSLGDNEIINNKLVLQSGKSQGTTQSVKKTLTQNPSYYLFQANGTQLDISLIELSLDGGLTYETAVNIEGSKDIKIIISNTGKFPVVKITIKSNGTYPNPQLENFGLLVQY